MIPFNNLKPIFQQHALEFQNAVNRVMKSGVYLMGPELLLFEKEFSHFVGTRYAVGVGSGTDALSLAVRSLGLSDQEVLVPANAYPTAFGVACGGAKMRLCDVDRDTLNVSVSTIKRALTNKTRGFVAVHLYGMPAPMLEIMEFAKKNKLIVIEDCAQAVGAMIGQKHVGTFGHAGCYSFYPTKNLAAMGDGGAVVSNSPKVASVISQLRMYGEKKRYYSLIRSSHSRLDEIQAAILLVRLKHIRLELKKRATLANRYRRLLPAVIQIPSIVQKQVQHAFHLLVIRSVERERLKNFLSREQIESTIHYPSPIHLQLAFSSLRYKKGNFPVAEQACKQVLSLPLYVGMSHGEQDRIVEAVKQGIKI